MNLRASVGLRSGAGREPRFLRVDSRVEGFRGSTSRMIRIISANPRLLSSAVSNEQNAERVDIAARVDVCAGHLRLLGAHVHRRSNQLVVLSEQRSDGQLRAGRLVEWRTSDPRT